MNPNQTFAFFALIAFVAFGQSAVAVPGDLDPTFGTGGKVTTAIQTSATVYSVAVQGDGKIVAAGSSYNGSATHFALARYNADGNLDTTFNAFGKVVTEIGTHSGAFSVAVQGDGKIVAAGHAYASQFSSFAVVRYNPNGSLDTSFNGTGKVTTSIGSNHAQCNSVVIQSDGKIVVAGVAFNVAGSRSEFTLARYNPDGSLDTTFNNTGTVMTDFAGDDDEAWSVVMQSDGKIVVAGESSGPTPRRFAVARYNANGTLDTTFNLIGKVTTALGIGGAFVEGSIAVQSDGKIVVAGSDASDPNTILVRYNPNGSLDGSFNGNGTVITPTVGSSVRRSVALQPDGKIFVAGTIGLGSNIDFELTRYNANGSLDTSFNGTGKVTTDFSSSIDGAYSVVLQHDGKIVVAGFSRNGSDPVFALARHEGDFPDIDQDGIADIYETATGIYVSATNTGTSPTIFDTDSDGLSDGVEVNDYHSNPNIMDTDGDGFDDGFEVSTGFSPTLAASTPDAVSTIRTAIEYRFNAAPGVSYRIEASTDLANWSTIETPIIGAGGVTTRFYSIEGQPKRFFRSRRN